MFDRFTDRARKVMALARKEAQRLNHDFIGTEHILLGLIEEGSGVAANVLKNLGVEVMKIREQIEKNVQVGTSANMAQLPFTPSAKKVLELSLMEANELGHDYIGTEHLLLGLIGVGAPNLDAGQVREEVIALLGIGPSIASQTRSQLLPKVTPRSGSQWLERSLAFFLVALAGVVVAGQIWQIPALSYLAAGVLAAGALVVLLGSRGP